MSARVKGVASRAIMLSDGRRPKGRIASTGLLESTAIVPVVRSVRPRRVVRVGRMKVEGRLNWLDMVTGHGCIYFGKTTKNAAF